jgi:hypothetical protein
VLDDVTDRQQSHLQGLIGRRADHVDVERSHLTPAAALDD